MILDINNNSFHGLPISEQQWKLLYTIDMFIRIHGYMPSNSEIVRLRVCSDSSMTRWLNLFEDKGYIDGRTKGIRKGNITEKGKAIIAEGDALERRWQAYRNSVISTKDKYVQEYGW